MTLVGNHTISPFPGPVAGPPVNANIVRGNDNQIQQAFNSHDLDPTVHVQSSALADRPAAGVVGRTWVTNDSGTYEHWYDDGTSWQRIYGVDYEEGTWTPRYFAATTDFTTNVAGAGTAGKYIKINDMVWVQWFMRTSSLSGGVGRVEVDGLPFVFDGGWQSFALGYCVNFAGDHPSAGYFLSGTRVRLLYRTVANGATALLDATDMGSAAANNAISGMGVYKTV